VRPGNNVIVLFGAGGDLARRKPPPGLFHLAAAFQSTAEAMLADRLGEAADVAAAHLYLTGDDFITRTLLSVDGGAVLV
jgi:hypothetical protein